MVEWNGEHATFLVGLILLGLAAWGFFWLPSPGATYWIHEVEPVDQLPESAEVIEYSELPVAAQRAFDAALAGERRYELREDEDATLVLREYDHVNHDGLIYRYRLIHGDTPGQGILIWLPVLAGLAGVVAIRYGLDRRSGSECTGQRD